MRSQKAFRSILSSSILLAVTMLSGLILPRVIIGAFGSEMNGLTSSIDQFVGYISIMEGGLGAVIHAALYRPLAEKNTQAVSSIIIATNRFFKSISYMFILYLVVLAFLYPSMIQSSFNGWFTSSLVVIIGISIFFEYSIGMPYQILLEADQKKYIINISQIGMLTANTMTVVVLVYVGASMHIVKLVSAFLFIIRPLLMRWYVHKKFNLNKKAKPAKEALAQRWDGFSHHIAFMIHSNTDILLITVFAPIREVSVYTIYYMIIASVRNIVMLVSQGVDAAFGNMIARNEKDSLRENFQVVELLMFALTTILFTSAFLLIIPFVSIYTHGITDADYIRPIFAYMMVAAQAAYCLKTPYSIIIRAAGHFRQTRSIAIQEAAINLVSSALLIIPFGLVGVAIGTFFSMTYRMVRDSYYLSKEMLPGVFNSFLKKMAVFLSGSILTQLVVKSVFALNPSSYIHWIVYASLVTGVAIIIVSTLSWIFYASEIYQIFSIVKRMITRGQKKKIIEKNR